jgi:hypothetical protein
VGETGAAGLRTNLGDGAAVKVQISSEPFQPVVDLGIDFIDRDTNQRAADLWQDPIKKMVFPTRTMSGGGRHDNIGVVAPSHHVF